MSIPKYHEIMLPLLKFAADGEEHSLSGTITSLAQKFNLSDEEKKKLLKSGQPIFDNRVGWAKTYLKKAGLIEYTKRGHFKITDRGLEVLEDDIDHIDNDYLKKFPEFVDFKSKSNDEEDDNGNTISNFENETPKEVLENAYQTLREDLAQELLDKIKDSPPDFFEKLVIDVLIAMGYGGSRREAGRAIGQVNDGGIDGIINEDILGLDIIYVQAKRWNNPVGRPDIQKFAGALEGRRAKKGVFISTSSFTREAKEYVSNINSKIVLIDGDLLASYMIDYNVGVSLEETYELKNIDNDYFID